VFEKNAGQAHRQVRYFGRTPGAALWLVDSGAVLSVDQKNRRAVLRMKLEGARQHPSIEGTQPLAGKTNYFTGNDPGQWKKDIGQYGAVRYQDAYPGIDLLFHATAQTIEYDWIVSPGADPSQIRMRFEGASETRIDSSGDLVLRIGDVEVREKRPRIFQGAQQDARQIDGRFVRRGRAIGFEIANYDRSRTLTIDPVLTYATHLGGSGSTNVQSGDEAYAVAMDAQGNAIVAGAAASTDFPTKNGLYTSEAAVFNAFIAKLNPAASGAASLVWSTYLGGSTGSFAYAVAVDSLSNVYVTGTTDASDFPLMNAFQTTFSENTSCQPTSPISCPEAFVTKISSGGNQLLYSSYLGGPTRSSAKFALFAENVGNAIAVDSSGNAWIAGLTSAVGFPVAGSRTQSTLPGRQSGFVTKVSPTGTALLYSTYLGGENTDALNAIALDSAGNAYVAGSSYSANFPTLNAYQSKLQGGSEAGVVAKINPYAQPSLLYSTFLGGTDGPSELYAIAVDTKGNIFVAGETVSQTFPVTANAVQTGAAIKGETVDGADIQGAVVAELNPALEPASQLAYSTFLAGGNYDLANSIALDSTGRIVVAGETYSVNFPVTPDAFQTQGPTFLSIIDPAVAGLKGLAYSTFYGAGGAYLDGMALNADATSATIVGLGSASVFVTPSAFQPNLNSQYGDAFIAQFNLTQSGPVLAAMVNAASFGAVTNFAPGEIVTLFGSNLGPKALVGAELDSTGHLATALAGCQLLVNRVPAPLVYVQADQVSAILPYELTPLIGDTLVNYAQMVCNSVPGNVIEFSVVAAVPGIFSAQSSGTGQAAVLNQDGSYNSEANPATAGSIVTLFETGEGVLTPAGQDGRIETGALSTIPTPALPITVTFGTTASPKITYAGVAPGEVDGLLQIDAQVPSGLTPGNVPIVVTIGKSASQSGLTIAVK
jgi:uncharacterized protein (TIGR03437 family)